MLELAIAEAYRPRATLKAQTSPSQPTPRKPPSFATNPNAGASTFSLRSRPPSALSRSTGTASQHRSFRSFISKRKRPDSVLSERMVVPEDVTRSDSVLSPAIDVSESPREDATPSRIATTPAREDFPRKPLMTPIDLPQLPPVVPLPPQEELEDFDKVLQAAISALQAATSTESQSRDPVTVALQHLAHVADIAACVATSWPEFWSMLVHASKLLISVLPAGNTPAKNVLVKSLAETARRWNDSQTLGGTRTTAELASVAGGVFDKQLSYRSMVEEKIGEGFAQWLNMRQRKQLHILTVDPTHAIINTVTRIFSAHPNFTVEFSMMSYSDGTPLSIPLGAVHTLPRDRSHITTYPPSATGTASQHINVLILDARCIDEHGSIQCARGALAAIVCVRTLSPEASIVAVGCLDSVGPCVEQEREVGVSETPVEWIPALFVDGYLTEDGVLRSEEVGGVMREASELERHILGADIG